MPYDSKMNVDEAVLANIHYQALAKKYVVVTLRL